MITQDDEVCVIALTREWGYALTTEGEAALDASLEQADGEPAVVGREQSVREEIPAPWPPRLPSWHASAGPRR